jgi:Protein of unknown function with PCYCGC motif
MSSARWLIVVAAVALMAQAGYHDGNDADRPPRITAAALPPLPAVNFVPPRPTDTVRAVFQFAALHPEVLHHIPCFCGCQNLGHRHNDDCFVKSRDAKGVPTEWEAHGMG